MQGPNAGLANAGHGHNTVPHQLELVENSARRVLSPVLWEIVSGLGDFARAEMLHERRIAVAVSDDSRAVLQSYLG